MTIIVLSSLSCSRSLPNSRYLILWGPSPSWTQGPCPDIWRQWVRWIRLHYLRFKVICIIGNKERFQLRCGRLIRDGFFYLLWRGFDKVLGSFNACMRLIIRGFRVLVILFAADYATLVYFLNPKWVRFGLSSILNIYSELCLLTMWLVYSWNRGLGMHTLTLDFLNVLNHVYFSHISSGDG